MPGLLQRLQGQLNRQTPRGEEDNLVTDIADSDQALMGALLGDAMGGKSKKPRRNKDQKIEYDYYRGGAPRASLGLLNDIAKVRGAWDKMPTPGAMYMHPYQPDRWDE